MRHRRGGVKRKTHSRLSKALRGMTAALPGRHSPPRHNSAGLGRCSSSRPPWPISAPRPRSRCWRAPRRWRRRAATSSISASASPISAPPTTSSRRRCKALRDGHHGYTPANGIPALREAVAADLERRRGVTVDPDDVVIVPGGKVTMFFAILMFGEPGAEILYPNPGFPIYESRHPLHRRDAGAGAAARGERLRLLGRGGAGADHAAHPPADHQQPGQPDRRRRAEGRARPPRRRARAAPACRGHERRDLRPHPLRRRRARLPALLPRAARPADPARRLVARPMP